MNISIGKEELAEKMLVLLNIIPDKEKELLKISSDRLALEQENSAIELKAKVQISMELTSDGKPLYSNEIKRSAEAEERLARNEQYNKNKEVLLKLKMQQEEESINLRSMIAKQKTYIALTRIWGD